MTVKLKQPDGSVQEYDDARAKLLMEKRGYPVVGVAPEVAKEDEPGDGTETPTSSAYNYKEAIGIIGGIDDSITLGLFVLDETRSTVTAAAEARGAKFGDSTE